MRFFSRSMLILFLLFCGFSPSHASGQLFMFANPNIGTPAKDFTLKGADGSEINMTKFREGSKAILFFWATWCPHCRAALHKLNENRQEYVKKDIKVLLVDIGEDAPMVNAYLKKNGIDMMVVLDEEQSLADSYGIIGVPTFFLLDKNGVIRAAENALPDDYEEILSK